MECLSRRRHVAIVSSICQEMLELIRPLFNYLVEETCSPVCLKDWANWFDSQDIPQGQSAYLIFVAFFQHSCAQILDRGLKGQALSVSS